MTGRGELEGCSEGEEGRGGGVRRVEGQCLPQDAKEKTEAGTEVQDSETTNSRQGPRFGPTLARKLPD